MGDAPPSPPDRTPTDVTSFLSDTLSITVEESPDVINVTIDVASDPLGGFLVADLAEGQVRAYTESGALRWHVGRLGEGPSEFRNLTAVRRLPDRRLAMMERTGRLTLRNEGGDSVLAEMSTNLRHVEDLEVVNDSVLVLAGVMGSDFSAPRIHLWDLKRRRIIRSFFQPFDLAASRAAATVAGWVRVALRGDSLAAVFAATDSVFLYRLDGERLRAFGLPSEAFRRVPEEEPETTMNPRQRAEWLGSFDLVGDVQWLNTDSILVMYQSVLSERALGREWHLLLMDAASGRSLLEATTVPKLLAVVPDGRLIFRFPGSEFPNQWLSGTFR